MKQHRSHVQLPGWRRVCCCVGYLLCLLWQTVVAQDALPPGTTPDGGMTPCDTLSIYALRPDTVAVRHLLLPAAFSQLGGNELSGSVEVLRPFWEKLRLLRAGVSTDTIRIVQIGDSHVRGRIFPRTTGQLMQSAFGNALSYVDVGINGAFCVTFTRADRVAEVAALRPDLLILSFGTNESHNRSYHAALHYQQMDNLVGMLRDTLPTVPMLLTTPPGSYLRVRQRKRRRSYSINPNTAIAAQTISQFAADKGLAVWNIYEILGGERRACLNWTEAGLMRPDHVHYMPEGYLLQGELFYQALIKAYNDDVDN